MNKFQDTFEIIHERAIIKYADKNYIDSKVSFGKYNKTTYISNFDVDIYQAFSSDVEVVLTSLKKKLLLFFLCI